MNHSALNYPGPNKYKYDFDGASSKAPNGHLVNQKDLEILNLKVH